MADNTEAARLAGIDACRGAAVTAVVLFLATRQLNWAFGVPFLLSAFQFGHAGADVFFVISGFIISYVHYEHIGTPARLVPFVWRRLTRLMPTYWVALAATVMMSKADGHRFPSLRSLAWSASLLASKGELLLGIAWTLRYQAVFYAMFCVLILSRTAGVLVLVLWLVGIVMSMLAGSVITGVPDLFFGSYNLQFFFGMAAAYVMRNYRVPRPMTLLTVGIVLFAIAAIAEDIGMLDGYADPARLAYGLPAALIVLGTTEAVRRSLITVPPRLIALGVASYSIYLFQLVFIGIVSQLLLMSGLHRWMPELISFAVMLMAVAAGGTLVSRWFEYPVMRLLRGQGLRVAPRAVV
jgi:exopolysaccharide production protein ExoZ